MQEHKKDKVTISGTERFGLLESNVIRLLEDLDNAEKCTRYKFKYRNNAIPNMDEIDIWNILYMIEHMKIILYK